MFAAGFGLSSSAYDWVYGRMNRDVYVDWMVATSPVTVSAWLDSNQLRLALCADFDTTIATRLTSMERVEKYARRCPVAGAEPADYRLREVQLFPDVAVLAGIHFRNLQLDRPFIGVYAQTRLLTDSETVEASKRLRLEFAGFAPKYVSWWSPEQHDLRHAPGAISDKRLIVGHLREIDFSSASLPEPLVVRRDSSGGSYQAYCEIFDDFIRRNPQWLEDLSKTDASMYEDCARAGVVLQLEADGRIVGIVAARSGAIRGIVGWEIVDEILAHSVRGRGLASSLQRLFLATLDTHRSPLVFGTIAAGNERSLRTALRVGRKDVGGWVFLPTTQ